MTDPSSSFQASANSAAPKFVSANQFSFEELAQIYNAARLDYLVPMSMNARHMEAYVRHYDVKLETSFVAVNDAGGKMGIGMLGLRGQRAWITRLGVLPAQREHHVGRLLVNRLIEAAHERSARQIQLEVIEKNEPARRLFLKIGFVEVRRLLVLDRPASVIRNGVAFEVKRLAADEVRECLGQRPEGASWIDENASLVHMERLTGLRVSLASGETSWIVFSETPIQLSHLVLGSENEQMALALLHAVHQLNPLLDTKLENLPLNSPLWPVFQRVGYVESFRRIEMRLAL